ncbi:MAG: hypothetical protein ABR584_04475 [Candidatus Baltobacteraceae bacterium]
MLALILIAALDAAPHSAVAGLAAPGPGTYHYSAYLKNKEVGNNTITIVRTAAGIKIDERSSVSLSAGDSRAQTSMLLDEKLLLEGYHGHYEMAEQTMDANVTLADRSATVTAGKDVKTALLGGTSKGFIVLDAAMVAGFVMLPAQMHALGNADATVLVPGTGESSFIEVIPDNKIARPPNVPAADVSISFAGTSPFVEWYDPQTFVVDEIIIPGQDLIVKRKA